ncbi:MAG TPA: hypothetical protein VGH39_01580 [Xanthobacteraceae bacterium]|jgi:hypothetical protein
MAIKLTLKVCTAVALGLLVFAALGPGKFVPRSGFGWQIDHVVGYFGFTFLFCLGWPRPRMVGGSLAAFAVLLEGLQAFTPDRHADLQAALYSAGGALAGAMFAELFIRAQVPRLLTGWTLSMAQPFRLLGPPWNNARAAVLTASGRARLFGSAVARGVAPQSPASVGLIAQPIPLRLRTDSSRKERMVSGRRGSWF